jgi:hypothetical protein
MLILNLGQKIFATIQPPKNKCASAVVARATLLYQAVVNVARIVMGEVTI